jgi:hypothetical protein
MMLIVFVSSDFEVLLNDNDDDDEDALNFEIFEVSICLYL